MPLILRTSAYKSGREAENCIQQSRRLINKVNDPTMKKNSYIIIASVLCILIASCSNTYQFCQVYETRSLNQDDHLREGNNELRYENSHCIIRYNFWSNGGTADFEFYNKTDEIIYIDLAKSFFVLNGEAFDIYRNREWSQGSIVGVASSMSYGHSASRSAALSVGLIEPSLTSNGMVAAKATKIASKSANIASMNAVTRSESSTVTIKEKQIIAVPPHSKKYIKTYSITNAPFLSCDLQRYPSQHAKLNFTAEDSPYHFSDIITYTIGDNTQHITVNNEFYVSSVTNYAEPEIVVMKQREEPCENMKQPDYIQPEYELFDKYIRDNICDFSSSFYNTYSVSSQKKLYDKNNNSSYIYNTQHQAYIKSGSKGSKGGVFVGVVLAGAIVVALVSAIIN